MNKEAISVLEELEWSGLRYGPGVSMGDIGRSYRACPICGQLEKQNGDFIASAAGHKTDCRLHRVLQSAAKFEQKCG